MSILKEVNNILVKKNAKMMIIPREVLPGNFFSGLTEANIAVLTSPNLVRRRQPPSYNRAAGLPRSPGPGARGCRHPLPRKGQARGGNGQRKRSKQKGRQKF